MQETVSMTDHSNHDATPTHASGGATSPDVRKVQGFSVGQKLILSTRHYVFNTDTYPVVPLSLEHSLQYLPLCAGQHDSRRYHSGDCGRFLLHQRSRMALSWVQGNNLLPSTQKM